jgi:hypothetical protein
VEPTSWVAVIVAVLGIFAECLRRALKAKDEKKVKREKDNTDRNDAWNRGDAGGVFNPPDD